MGFKIINCFLITILARTSFAFHTTDYEEKGLQMHNEYRHEHNACPMRLNKTLNQIAGTCARYYSLIGGIDHSCPYKTNRMGENLYLSYRTEPLQLQAHVEEAIKFWYNEVGDYSFENPGVHTNMIGHFTQLVWNASNQLGVGIHEHGLETVVVALYTPRGNLIDPYKTDHYHLYKKNVLPSSGSSLRDLGHFFLPNLIASEVLLLCFYIFTLINP